LQQTKLNIPYPKPLDTQAPIGTWVSSVHNPEVGPKRAHQLPDLIFCNQVFFENVPSSAASLLIPKINGRNDKDNQTNGGEDVIAVSRIFSILCAIFVLNFLKERQRPREVANSGKFEFFNHN
jgi:hypothetical protein